jgi:hypothetical protein
MTENKIDAVLFVLNDKLKYECLNPELLLRETERFFDETDFRFICLCCQHEIGKSEIFAVNCPFEFAITYGCKSCGTSFSINNMGAFISKYAKRLLHY